MKAKLRKFNSVIKTNFLGDKVPREGVRALRLHGLCNY